MSKLSIDPMWTPGGQTDIVDERGQMFARCRDRATAERIIAALANLLPLREALEDTTFLLGALASFTEERVSDADVSLARASVERASAVLIAVLAPPQEAASGDR